MGNVNEARGPGERRTLKGLYGSRCARWEGAQGWLLTIAAVLIVVAYAAQIPAEPMMLPELSAGPLCG